VLTAAQLNNITTLPINDQTASYTLVAGDVGKRVIMNVASANTVTVDDSVFGEGDTIFIANKGAGTTTVTAGAGVTINTSGSLALTQYGGGTLVALSASTFTFFPGSVNNTISVEFLVIGGGGGSGGNAGGYNAGGGGAGGYRCSVVGENSGAASSAEPALALTPSVAYTITIGAGGATGSGTLPGSTGSDTHLYNVVSVGGGGGGAAGGSTSDGSGGGKGGSGGGRGARNAAGFGTAGAGVLFQGLSGANYYVGGSCGGGGGSSAAATATAGGAGTSSSIDNSATTRAVGGAANGSNTAGGANTGTGGSSNTGAGGSGIVIIRYKDSYGTLTVGAGLTYTTNTYTSGGTTYRYYSFTAGTDTVTF
jgi:hypothetical protein